MNCCSLLPFSIQFSLSLSLSSIIASTAEKEVMLLLLKFSLRTILFTFTNRLFRKKWLDRLSDSFFPPPRTDFQMDFFWKTFTKIGYRRIIYNFFSSGFAVTFIVLFAFKSLNVNALESAGSVVFLGESSCRLPKNNWWPLKTMYTDTYTQVTEQQQQQHINLKWREK